MVLNLSMNREFIPKWNGNEQSDKPIKVTYSAPTMQHYSNLIKKPVLKMTLGKSNEVEGGEIEYEVDYTRFVRTMVTGIQNLSYIIDGGKEIVIKDKNDLFSSETPAVFAGLIDEIGSFLKEELEKKVDEKK
jgi:hypothetical protein